MGTGVVEVGPVVVVVEIRVVVVVVGTTVVVEVVGALVVEEYGVVDVFGEEELLSSWEVRVVLLVW